MHAILILIIMIIAPWILLATILWAFFFDSPEEKIERSKEQERRRNVNQQPKALDPEDVKKLEEGRRR